MRAQKARSGRLLAGVTFTVCIVMCGWLHAHDGRPSLADAAVSPNSDQAREAIEQLRQEGPAGLAVLLQAHTVEIQKHRSQVPAAGPASDESWQRLSSAIDAVAAQRDAYASGLYWYTDLDAARAAAKASGKPILSLRLLGRLDQELSCANSRFFRTVLYANTNVSHALRDHFILHWKSERPVPTITIDFGDGRKMQRTITGNSIHYVLDADGRVIDAIPGLYGPDEFLRQVEAAAQIEITARGIDPSRRAAILRAWHQQRQATETVAYRADLMRLRQAAYQTARPKTSRGGAPPAAAAARAAVGKGAVEMPAVLAVTGDQDTSDDSARWTAIAALHPEYGHLDASSTALMAAKHPATAAAAARVAMSKTIVESPLVRLVRNFERSVAADTARNEYLLHPRVHAWLASDPSMANMETLDVRVYAELFLTPRSDPWLGLAPADAYSALENEGLVDAGR